MKSYFRYTVIALAFKTAVAAVEPTTIEEALAYANSPGTMNLQHGSIKSDQKALEIAKQHPVESKAYVIAALSKGGRRGRVDAEILIKLIREPNESADAIDKIVSSYPLGDPETPFLQALAAKGQESYLPRILGVIEKHPDAQLSKSLAEFLVQSGNPVAQKAITDLVSKLPGSWKESYNIQQFIGDQNKAVDSVVPVVATTPAGERAKVSTRLKWGAVSILLLVVAVVVFRRNGNPST